MRSVKCSITFGYQPNYFRTSPVKNSQSHVSSSRKTHIAEKLSYSITSPARREQGRLGAAKRLGSVLIREFKGGWLRETGRSLGFSPLRVFQDHQ